ncbi:hypothetical protein [Streptomyces beijiangensis]|uniref:Uncharacterized protein n=1 Tax=Streptomyces beijiangensis TaxID=163361 RepID=A0A939JFR2_9ACTN|nr:hypothetical protein [Streptomyces beijiangensis]MBO0510305.1 hypothetical protein [Streptomyces beijiangensis]
MAYPQLVSVEAAVVAVREVAQEYQLEVEVTHDIGADQTSRRTAAGVFAIMDADGSMPHEAYVELGGRPAVTVQLFPDGDAKITVEGVEFHDIPRDSVPVFLRSVYGGLAHVTGKLFPPGHWLVVPLPGDQTYKEMVLRGAGLSRWLSARVRP